MAQKKLLFVLSHRNYIEYIPVPSQTSTKMICKMNMKTFIFFVLLPLNFCGVLASDPDYANCDTTNCAQLCDTLRCGEYCSGVSCASYCGANYCGQYCQANYCAKYCQAENCGQNCKGKECASDCKGNNCGNNCLGIDCATNCSNSDGTLNVGCGIGAKRPDLTCSQYTLEWHCKSELLENNCTWTGEKCMETGKEDEKDEKDENNETLSVGIIIVIVVISSLVLAAAIYFYYKRRKNKNKKGNDIQSIASKLIF